MDIPIIQEVESSPRNRQNSRTRTHDVVWRYAEMVSDELKLMNTTSDRPRQTRATRNMTELDDNMDVNSNRISRNSRNSMTLEEVEISETLD